jgi:hypothetical protein
VWPDFVVHVVHAWEGLSQAAARTQMELEVAASLSDDSRAELDEALARWRSLDRFPQIYGELRAAFNDGETDD